MTVDDYAARAAEFDARIARWAHILSDASLALTVDQAEGFACVACGQLRFGGSGAAVPIGYAPGGGQVFVCCGCDDQSVTELAERAKSAPLPPNLSPAAALAALANDLEFEGQHEYAAQARAIVASLGYMIVAADELRAAATMLTVHAPGVADTARAAGERFLSVVGEQ